MTVTGPAGGEPMRAGPPIADLVAGLYGALGICAALVRRGRTGSGDTVGASLNNGLISLLAYLAANHLATGEEPRRTGNDHPIVSPYGMFRTADGEVALAPSQEQSYQRLVDALGMPELRQDPRFLTNDLRVAQPGGDERGDRGAPAHRHDRVLDREIERRRRALRPRAGIGRGVLRSAGARSGDGAEPGASRPRHRQDARLPDQIRRGAVPSAPPRSGNRRRYRRRSAASSATRATRSRRCAAPESYRAAKPPETEPAPAVRRPARPENLDKVTAGCDTSRARGGSRPACRPAPPGRTGSSRCAPTSPNGRRY